MGGCPEHPPRLWAQVLGREGPFPLILLPQFGGYWIEGTNHQLSGAPDSPPTPVPGTRAKLEGNHTAKIYRKHFLGKVRPWGAAGAGSGVGRISHGYGGAGARRPHELGHSWVWGSLAMGALWVMDMGAHGRGYPWAWLPHDKGAWGGFSMGMEGHGDPINTGERHMGACGHGCPMGWVVKEVGVGSPWAGEPLAGVPTDVGSP